MEPEVVSVIWAPAVIGLESPSAVIPEDETNELPKSTNFV